MGKTIPYKLKIYKDEEGNLEKSINSIHYGCQTSSLLPGENIFCGGYSDYAIYKNPI